MTSAVKRGATSSTRDRDTQTAREETHLWTRSVHVHVTMKIYFCGSIRGGRDDVMLYRKIVEKLQSYGTVLTEHVSSTELSHRGVCDVIELMSCHWSGVCDVTELMSCHWSGEDASAAGDRFIHDRDVNWLRQSDVVVAEVTQPSLGVGYELGRVVDMKKKTLCLFRPSSARVLSAMIRGADDGERFVVRDYGEDEVDEVLEEFFNALKRT
ncbi:putative 2'-deoxynucleoside 5'-phosphate N-hydrolase 1 isoform 5 [Scophthalmus maximus]|uniref:2'-deoxynucleoside 5'-phosphate N-hydrolase 1 n=1 Tax=Scophthalmus maximus TaxID=52904 RepID=A0A2U9CES2_SCOMX|nr:2'-deoxynucleoside 5'-phosphate N-hydrolase 1 isoform X1 [Scophthalmus maximus]AWP14713.1 putative 2'-deoxynucleoside 5'-phosphate N-hydrolase 1 isoform 5 [Scophthalmus maximus]